LHFQPRKTPKIEEILRKFFKIPYGAERGEGYDGHIGQRSVEWPNTLLLSNQTSDGPINLNKNPQLAFFQTKKILPKNENSSKKRKFFQKTKILSKLQKISYFVGEEAFAGHGWQLEHLVEGCAQSSCVGA
jgi:hypothetical protein